MPAIDTTERGSQSTASKPRLPRGGDGGPAALTELRRFHVGLPPQTDAAASPQALPQGLLPALLQPYRGAAVRGDFPLFVPPGSAGGEALPLTCDALLERAMPAGEGDRALRDNGKRLLRHLVAVLAADPAAASADARRALTAAGEALRAELALADDHDARLAASLEQLVAAVPADGRWVAWGPGATLELLRLAIRAHLQAAREAFLAEARQVAAGLAAMLGGGRGDGEAESIGSIGSRFVDSARLAGLTQATRGAASLDEPRRRRLEEARATLGRFIAGGAMPEPTLVMQSEAAGTLPAAPASGWRVVASKTPFEAAAEEFDRAAEELAGVLRAMRRGRLELAGDYLPERHGPVLERLDWRAFTPREMALLAPVACLASGDHAANGGLLPLSRLLLSGRPVQALVFLDPAANPGEGGEVVGYRFEPASLGIGHREAFVQQSSLARPLQLAAGLSRALACGRASLHVLDTPPSPAAAGAPASVDPWLLAGAALEGRAHPLFVYDPGAGEGWARRLDFSRNPEPGADWPSGELEVAKEGGGESTLSIAFTFADYALLDPLWHPQFRPLPPGLEHEDLLPLAEWLALEPEEAGHRLPWIWAVDGGGTLHRLAVGRRLARACHDRLDFWRTLQEMAGLRSEYAERAAETARREAASVAEEERARLDEAHRAELERVRRTAAEEVVDRLTSALLEVDVTALPRVDGTTAPFFGGDVESVTSALLSAVAPDSADDSSPEADAAAPSAEVAELTSRLLSVLDEEALTTS